MGWDQRHCKDYQIHFPTTIHGSKSELKWLRYPKNRVKRLSTLHVAITFDPIVRFPISLVFWETRHLELSRDIKISTIWSGKTFKYASKTRLEKTKTANVNRGGRHTMYGCQKLKGQISARNASRPLILQRKKKDFGQILSFFSLISLPSTSKHLWFFSFLHNHKVVFLHSIFLSSVPYLGFEV